MASRDRRLPKGVGWAITALVFVVVLIAFGPGRAIVVALIAVALYAVMEFASKSRSRSDR